MALGKAKFALSDLTRVLELKPDFVAARFQRGTVHMKVGDYTSAERDFYDVLQVEPYHQDANYWYGRVQPARDQYVYVLEAIRYNNHAQAIQLMTQLLEISPWSKELREMRADSHIAVGDILSAVSDLKSVNRLTQDSTDGYFKLSHLLYQIGHASDALKEIRECLKLDPEHRDCFPFYKKIKKVEKALTDAQKSLESGDFDDCLDATKRVLKLETEMPMIIFNAKQLSCTCHVKAEKYSEAIGQCREALEIQKEAGVLCDRAEAYMETDMFEDGKSNISLAFKCEIFLMHFVWAFFPTHTAIHDYQSALEMDEHLQRAKEGLEKAKARQKQSERRDYYKILGVTRKATKREIVKAYRKMAQKWHPDAYQGDAKKVAEKKFIDVAAAKEVLTDDKKREQFDNGEDPLDPEAGQGFRGQNPFQHFYHGSPFQFKFHFN